MPNKTHQSGRDAESGRFIPVDQARRNPKTTVVEKIPNRAPATPPKRPPGKGALSR